MFHVPSRSSGSAEEVTNVKKNKKGSIAMSYHFLTPSELTALKTLTDKNRTLPGDELINEFLYLARKKPPQSSDFPRPSITPRLRDLTQPVYSMFLSASASERNAEALGIRLTGTEFSGHGGDLLQSIIELLPGLTLRKSMALSFVVRAAILNLVPPQEFRAWQWGVPDLYGLAREHELRIAREYSLILKRYLQKESTVLAHNVPEH